MSGRKAPPALIAHARSVSGLFEALRLRLRDPKAALPARPSRAIDASLSGAYRTAALRLCDAADEAVWAVEEIERLSFPVDEQVLRLSSRLRDAARAIARALAASGEASERALIEAKKMAAEAERLRRLQRGKAHEDALFVDALKREGIAKRLSDSAEALQKAADAAAETLVSP